MKRLSKLEAGQQKRLYEQLDFFGAKKKRFISIYASKPRIRIKTKIPDNIYSFGYASLQARQQDMAAQQAVFQGLSGPSDGRLLAVSQMASLQQHRAMKSAARQQQINDFGVIAMCVSRIF